MTLSVSAGWLMKVRVFESALDGKAKSPKEGYFFYATDDLEWIIIQDTKGKELGRYSTRHISYIEWEDA